MSLCVCVCVFSVIVLHSSQFTKINNLRVYLDRIYFAETKNWKHCSKIIFKCVNSAVGPIFNEKINKKWNLWVHKQCMDTLFTEDWSKVVATVHVPYINSTACWGKGVKKKKGKRRNLKRSNRGSKLCLNSQKRIIWILVMSANQDIITCTLP